MRNSKIGFASLFERGIVIVLLVLSVGLNVVLARKLNERSRPAGASFISVGTAVAPLEATDLEGRRIIVDYGDVKVPTVLYVLSPDCPWCMRNSSNIKALAAERGSGFRFIGVALKSDGLKEYVARQQLGFPIYVATEEAKKKYLLRTLPETIVVAPDGTVLQNWGGAYGDEIARAIEQYFEVRLPGLTQLPPSPNVGN